MAATKKSAAQRAAKETEKAEVDVNKLAKDVEELGGAMSRILDILEKKADTPVTEPKDIAAVPVTESAKAVPNKVQSNPEWEAVAKEILGPALEHTEVEHERSGGIKFTVVVHKDYSNAGSQYLALTGQDRRTMEVSAGGLQAVEEWCKRIKANLARTPRVVAR